jgi:PmbA protein
MAEAIEKQYNVRKVAARQDDLLHLARETLRVSSADQTQIRLNITDSALTRFASSEIHQNTFERQATATITARVSGPGGLQEGQVTTNRLDPASLSTAVHQAADAARLSPPNPDLADFALGPYEYPFQVDYYEATAACTPEERARRVIKGFEIADDRSYTAAGTLATSQVNFAVANSRGVEAAFNTTHARYTVQWNGADSSGYADSVSRSIADIDTEEASVRAYATAKRSAAPRGDIPAGRYTVILGPECVATMLGFLTWMGLSARDYLDGASFMYGRLGEPVTGRNITIADDPLDPRTLGLPCDFAGVPKQHLTLIESGVARNVAHDVNTAARAGVQSTGHDLGGREPGPVNLVMVPGTSTREELIAGVSRGIYVSRFHYTNVVDPLNTVITGMTRDGTFLIENGELAGGVTNFRFTQSILKALASIPAMTQEQVYQGSMWGAGCVVPEAVRVDDFNFSGKTSF